MQGIKQERKSSKLLPTILLTLLVMQMSYARSGSQLPNDSGSKYGIDLTKSYTGKEVQALIDIVVEESEKSIEAAYNAGYKQGVLAYKPDVEYWKIKAQGFERELQKQRLQSWVIGLGGISIGLLGGMGLGFGLRLSY
ncbi:hypothetical protein [Treponema lecithinolyticum]|uniref:hypothetical protein n=1 Tax=Treponema lecithinolyticum TaxID=53418 RepID=UPI0028ED0E20|nr:hypothetical protein [Treponema lecithinolyticum]